MAKEDEARAECNKGYDEAEVLKNMTQQQSRMMSKDGGI